MSCSDIRAMHPIYPPVCRKEIKSVVAQHAKDGKYIISYFREPPTLRNWFTNHLLAAVFDAAIIRDIVLTQPGPLMECDITKIQIKAAIAIGVLDYDALTEDEITLLHEHDFMEVINMKIVTIERDVKHKQFRITDRYKDYITDGLVNSSYKNCVKYNSYHYATETKNEFISLGLSLLQYSGDDNVNVQLVKGIYSTSSIADDPSILAPIHDPEWRINDEWVALYKANKESLYDVVQAYLDLMLPADITERSDNSLRLLHRLDMRCPHYDAADTFALVIFMCDDLIAFA